MMLFPDFLVGIEEGEADDANKGTSGIFGDLVLFRNPFPALGCKVVYGMIEKV